MNQGQRARLGVRSTLAWLLLLLAHPCQAQDDPAEVQRQITRAREQIAGLQQQLENADDAYRAQTARLREAEKLLSETTASIRDLSLQAAATEGQIQTLAANEEQLNRSLQQQQAQLARQLRVAHAQGRQPALQLLLSIDRAPELGRLFHYFRLFNTSRIAQLDALRAELAQLAALRRQLNRLRQQQSGRQQQLAASKVLREKQLQTRQAAIAALEEQISRDSNQLAQLDRDKQRLESLLAQLQALFADIPGGLDDEADFASLKGRLSWPADGTVEQPAGSSKPAGMHRWGILFSAPAGSPVRAISYGRVAFADWLRGFGLLTIVDHGNGYLSLYAFSDALFHEAGDWVAAGQVLASSGSSGGRSDSGLYFELRHDGQPVDPRPWWRE